MATVRSNTHRVEEHIKTQNVKRGLERLDKRSARGMNGAPKKGGQGGKFTWSGSRSCDHHDLQPALAVLDEKDPNYVDNDDEEDDQIVDAEKSARSAGDISSGSKS